jgi:hypothetical protein
MLIELRLLRMEAILDFATAVKSSIADTRAEKLIPFLGAIKKAPLTPDSLVGSNPVSGLEYPDIASSSHGLLKGNACEFFLPHKLKTMHIWGFIQTRCIIWVSVSKTVTSVVLRTRRSFTFYVS